MPKPDNKKHDLDSLREQIQQIASASIQTIQQATAAAIEVLDAVKAQASPASISTQIANFQQEIDIKMSQLDDRITEVTASVAKIDTVKASVDEFISHVPGWINTAVQQAIDAGATTAQLQSLKDLSARLEGDADAISAAIVAGTPAAPPAA